MSTVSEVRFTICGECGRHGYVDLGNARMSNVVFCRKDARSVVSEYYFDDLISDRERDKLLLEIRESGLPEDIDPFMRNMLEFESVLEVRLDALLLCKFADTSETEYVEGIHDLLDRYFPDRQRSHLLN